MGLVRLAYALCRSVGTVADQRFKPIARKKHGYRATSLSRHGLNLLRQLTRPGTLPHEPLARKITALLDWFIRHLIYCQATKIVG